MRSLAQSWTPAADFDAPSLPLSAEELAQIALRQQQQMQINGPQFDPRTGNRPARAKGRRTIDHFGPVARYDAARTMQTRPGDAQAMRAQANYVIDLLPPDAYESAALSLCTRYAHTSTNKMRCPVNYVSWTPEGRRLLTGSTSGEFTLWNGLTFNFETIVQAHQSAVRAGSWSHSGIWLVSVDNGGKISYFQTNMNNLATFSASAGSDEPLRDVSWAPNDARFVTGADDKMVRIFDFGTQKEETGLVRSKRRPGSHMQRGHLWDVRAAQWHPKAGLIASGGKDNLIKFWDPRTGKCLATLPNQHKGTVQALRWDRGNGHLLASASRDSFMKVFDIRMQKSIQTFRGHEQEVCCLEWHPVRHDLLASGGSEGSILHWSVDSPTPRHNAHESSVWSLAFHELGHLLASGSNDHCVRWWSRPRPGVQTVGLPRARDAGAPEDIDDDDGSLPGLAHANAGRGRGQAPSRAATSSNRAPLPARGPYSRPDNLARPPNGIPGFGAPAARGAADPHAAASNWRDRVMALQQQTSAPPGSGWR